MEFPDPKIKSDYYNIYVPSDDSFLIIDYFKRTITRNLFDGLIIEDVKNILDLGTGTGIIALFLQILKNNIKNFNPKIYASDILQDAIECAKFNEKQNNLDGSISFIRSDLFESFPEHLKQLFDVIIFNPPYLPSSELIGEENRKKIDSSWEGGSTGYDVFLNFLNAVKPYLNIQKESRCYIYYISSSYTDLSELKVKIKEKGFENTTLDKIHIFFEDIILNRLKLIDI